MSILFQKLSDAVVDMNEELVEELAYSVIEEKVDAFEAIDKGLTPGMDRAGRLFEEQEYFVPELLMCADAMNIGVEILKPHIQLRSLKEKHKVVIGVIEGDTHDIGKNLVKLMLETSNFDVVDLGRDVPPQVFVDKAKEERAEIIMISSLMTTTMDAMADVVELLSKQGLKDEFRVVVGGGPISQGFADKIGADGYSKDAAGAVRLCKRMVGEEVAYD